MRTWPKKDSWWARPHPDLKFWSQMITFVLVLANLILLVCTRP